MKLPNVWALIGLGNKFFGEVQKVNDDPDNFESTELLNMSNTGDFEEDEDVNGYHPRGWHGIRESLNEFDLYMAMLDEISALGIVQYIEKNGWASILERCEQDDNFCKMSLTVAGNRLLHVAVLHGDEQVLKEVLEIVGKKGHKAVNNVGNTALHLAAIKGDKKMCEMLVGFIGLRIKNNKRETALYTSASYGHTDCFNVLLHRALLLYGSRQDLLFEICTASYGDTVLHLTIRKRRIALAKIIVDKLRFLLASKKDNHETPLHCLAKCPELFKSGSELGFIASYIYSRIPQGLVEDITAKTYLWPSGILELKRTHWISNYILEKMLEFLVKNEDEDFRGPVASAISEGIVEIIDQILRIFPELIGQKDEQQQNLIFVAVKTRKIDIVKKLLEHMNAYKLEGEALELDANGENILHVAGRFVDYKPWSSLGFNSQLMLEIQWFEFIQSWAPDYLLYLPSGDNMLPLEVFDTSHQDLRIKSQKWVKAFIAVCLIVVTMFTVLSVGTFNSISVAPNTLSYNIYYIGSLAAAIFGLISLFSFVGAASLNTVMTRSYKLMSFGLLMGISAFYWCCLLILTSIWYGKANSEKGDLEIITEACIGGVVLCVIYLAAFQLIPFLNILQGLVWTL